MKNNAYEGIDFNSWSSVDFDASSGFVVSWEARSANWFVSNENYWRREQMTVDLPSPRTSRIASSTSSKKLCTRHKVFENPKSDYSIREYVDDSICKCGRYFSPPSNLHFSGSCHTINIDIRHQLSCLSRQKPLDGLHYNGTLCNRCVSNHDCAGNMSPIATIVSSSSSSLTQRRSGCERYKHDIMPPEDTDDQRSCRPVASSSNYKIACHVVNSGANREGTRQLPAIFAGDQDLLTSSNLISSGHYEETLCWDEIYQPRPFTSAAGGPVVNSEKFQEDVKGNNLGTSGRELHRWKPNSIWKSSVPRFARRNKCSDARDSLASDGHVDTPSPPNRTAPTQPVQSIWISDACENNSSPEECESNLMASVTHLNSVVIAMPIGESSNSCADVGSSLEHITGRKRLSFDDLNYKYACDNINARTSFMRNSTCGESGRKSSDRNGIKSEQMMLDTSPTSVYRPLPDQSAFDRFALGNLNGASNDCGRAFHLHQGSWLTSPIQSLAACPATPLRTPTWILTSTAIYNTANEGSAGVEVPVRLHTMRPSSLIATKVLFSQCGTPEKSDVSFYRDFEQEDFLGSGVSADVFKAKEKGGKKFYAVKKIKQRFRSKKDRCSMMGEVTIMKKLGFEPCKHIVQLVKAWQEDAHFYVQLDFAELGTLSDLLRNVALKMGRFTDRAVWCIVNNVSAGLCHIHKHGIVHLGESKDSRRALVTCHPSDTPDTFSYLTHFVADIKPANLLISIEGVIKICDFGSAVEEGNHEDSHEGDTRYIKPLFDTSIIDFCLFQTASSYPCPLFYVDIWRQSCWPQVIDTHLQMCSPLDSLSTRSVSSRPSLVRAPDGALSGMVEAI